MKKVLCCVKTLYQVFVCMAVLNSSQFKSTSSDIIFIEPNSSNCVSRQLNLNAAFDSQYIINAPISTNLFQKTVHTVFGVANSVLHFDSDLIEVYNTNYNIILYYNNENTIESIISNSIKTNPGVEIYRIEDGLGSYLQSSSARSALLGRKVWTAAFRLLRRPAYNDKLQGYFLFEPDLIQGSGRHEKLLKINVDVREPHFLGLCNDVFRYAPMKIRKPFIYLEDGPESLISKSGFDLKVLAHIAGVVGKGNVVVKAHPRGDAGRFLDFGFDVLTSDSLPWELVLLNQDVSSITVLSFLSTAAISPFRFKGMNPNTIILSNLDPQLAVRALEPGQYSMYLSLIEKIGSDRIFVPGSLSELDFILSGIGTA